VSGEKCRHPRPEHGRYLRAPNKKKSAKPKTYVFSKPTISFPTEEKQLMVVVAGLYDHNIYILIFYSS